MVTVFYDVIVLVWCHRACMMSSYHPLRYVIDLTSSCGFAISSCQGTCEQVSGCFSSSSFYFTEFRCFHDRCKSLVSLFAFFTSSLNCLPCF
jgi:hypothetical protein